MTTRQQPNIHPGDILLEDFIEPMGLTKSALATAIGVPAARIGEITRGARAITADTDLRLSRYFGTSEGYWLRLQIAYGLEKARRAIGGPFPAIVTTSNIYIFREVRIVRRFSPSRKDQILK